MVKNSNYSNSRNKARVSILYIVLEAIARKIRYKKLKKNRTQ